MRKVLMVGIIIIMLMLPACSESDHDGPVTEIPAKSEYEMGKVWGISMDREPAASVIENGKVYIVSEGNVVYICDEITGAELKHFKIPEMEGEKICSGIAVYNDVLALNYKSYIKVVDTNSGTLICQYESGEAHSYVGLDYDILLHENILICYNLREDKLKAVDFRTGSVVWEIEGGKKDEGLLRPCKYQDKYFYRKNIIGTYSEFDPTTGITLKEYPITSVGRLDNEDVNDYTNIWSSSADDEALNQWMVKQISRYCELGTGKLISYNANQFYLNNSDGTLVWKAYFKNPIDTFEVYEKYAILVFEEQVAILDTESLKIISSEKFRIAGRPQSYVNGDRLYLPGKDNRFEVYDLKGLGEIGQ